MMIVNSKSNQNSPQKNKMNAMANNTIYNAQSATSKHPILANKQQKMQQQLQFKQTLANQQQI